MQRSSIIATVIAAGGILIAGSVASVAVINAASSSEAQSTNLDLVADDAPAAAPASSAPAATDSAVAPVELPSLEASALPELPQVADASQAAAPAAAPAQPVAKTAKSQTKPAGEPTKSADPGISSDQARSIVMKQGDGVKALAVGKDSHQGYQTWAVRVERASGEVITGYVDRDSGVVIDWVVNSKPAAPAATTSGSSSHEDDSKESEDHSGSSTDSEDHESEDHSESEDD